VPDLGPATTAIVQQFERALAGKKEVRDTIRTYSLKPSPTIKDLLELAWLRNWLALLEPPLPDGVPVTAASVWAYWVEHAQEFAQIKSLDAGIQSYLYSREQLHARSMSARLEMLNRINTDAITYLALYPLVDAMFENKSGRPATRGTIAVRALQLKIDSRKTWKQITREVCDCGQSVHNDYCQANLRQSVRALEKLLRKCRLQAPNTMAS